MRFGEVLRKERERRAVTLDGISASSRISLRHLEALEADRFADLPGGVFNRGIVRSYARFCGLNEDEMLRQYLAAAQDAGVAGEAATGNLALFAENVRRSRAPRPVSQGFRWLSVAGMLLAVLALATLTVFVLHRHRVLAFPHRHSVAIGAAKDPMRLSNTRLSRRGAGQAAGQRR